MRRGSSRRRTFLPTSSSGLLMVVVAMLCPLPRGRGLHGVDDVLIPGASAEIAFEAVANFFISGIRIIREKLFAHHDHAGRAETALQAVLVPEGLLQGVEFAV